MLACGKILYVYVCSGSSVCVCVRVYLYVYTDRRVTGVHLSVTSPLASFFGELRWISQVNVSDSGAGPSFPLAAMQVYLCKVAPSAMSCLAFKVLSC